MHRLDQEIGLNVRMTANRVVSESSKRRTSGSSGLHARSAHLKRWRHRIGGDRLRGEFRAGRGAGEVLRACHETIEAGLPVVSGSRRDLSAAAATDIDRSAWSVIVSSSTRPPASSATPRTLKSAERDSGTGPRLGNQPSDVDGWVLKVGELLIPLVAAMRRELISGSYIQADETPVDVQTREGRGQNHQAYLWQYSRPGGSVVFDFRLGRGRDGPKRGKQPGEPSVRPGGRNLKPTQPAIRFEAELLKIPTTPTALPALPSPLLALGEESIA